MALVELMCTCQGRTRKVSLGEGACRTMAKGLQLFCRHQEATEGVLNMRGNSILSVESTTQAVTRGDWGVEQLLGSGGTVRKKYKVKNKDDS